MPSQVPPLPVIPGRGPNLNPANRFDRIQVEPDAEWLDAEFAKTGSIPLPRTQFFHDATESILVKNDSPDLGRGWGLNPYRGCEQQLRLLLRPALPRLSRLEWRHGI